MSPALPQSFDPWRLAAQDVRASGEIDTSGMQRLVEALASEEPATVAVELHVFEDTGGRARLQGRIETELVLTCQRCMESVRLPVRGEFSLVAIEAAEDADGVPEDADPLILEKGPKVVLQEMIEDELILALPVIARHENIEDCGPRGRILAKVETEADENEEALDEPEDRKENPFEVLKKLKTDHTD